MICPYLRQIRFRVTQKHVHIITKPPEWVAFSLALTKIFGEGNIISIKTTAEEISTEHRYHDTRELSLPGRERCLPLLVLRM